MAITIEFTSVRSRNVMSQVFTLRNVHIQLCSLLYATKFPCSFFSRRKPRAGPEPIQLKFPVQIQIEIVGLLTRSRFVALPGKFAWSRFTRPRSIDRLWSVHGNFKHIMNPWTRCSDCTGSFAYTARSRKPVSEDGNYLITNLVTQARAHYSRHSFSWRHCFHVIALNSPPHTVFIVFNIGLFTPSSFKYHVFSSSK